VLIPAWYKLLAKGWQRAELILFCKEVAGVLQRWAVYPSLQHTCHLSLLVKD
jgi:hypothetical protein